MILHPYRRLSISQVCNITKIDRTIIVEYFPKTGGNVLRETNS